VGFDQSEHPVMRRLVGRDDQPAAGVERVAVEVADDAASGRAERDPGREVHAVAEVPVGHVRRPAPGRDPRDSQGSVTLTQRPYTISDLLNVFSAAGLWIETAIEPQLSEDAQRRYPHKQAWMNKHLGILLFKLRPHPSR
jgi:hypothetical protein